MAITIVQRPSFPSSAAGTSDSTNLAFANTPAEGNLLVAALAVNQGFGDITFNTPSGWTILPSNDPVYVTGGIALAVFYKIAPAASPKGISLSWGGVANYYVGMMYELAGVDPTSPIDKLISQSTPGSLTWQTGVFEFWATTGARYDIVISASGFTTRTLRWDNAYFPPGPRSITVDILAADVIPIGVVIDWWRPVSTVPVPSGWAICDGSTVLAANHDFPGGGSIVLPDLRGAFVLGANIANSDNTAATAGSDLASGAPGIGGKGSSHVRNLAHTHSVDPNSATTGQPSNTSTSGAGTLTTTGSGILTTSTPSATLAVTGAGGANVASSAHTHTVASHTHDLADHSHSMPHTHTIDIPATTSSSSLASAQDIKPKYVGLLKLVKVQNS